MDTKTHSRTTHFLGRSLLRGKRSKELGLLLGSLEPSVSKLGGSIDELDIDGLQVLPGRMLHQRLTQNQGTLLNSNNGSLHHHPVLADQSVVNESSHGVDALLGQIGLGLTAVVVSLLSNTVNLLVHFGTVEVSVLTGTGNSVTDTGRVPRSNTGNLTETTMGLTGKTSNSPTGGDTFISTTLGNSNNIDKLVLGENRVNSHLLLEKRLGKINLGLGIGSSVNLDFHDVSLLHTEVKLLHLRVGDDTNDLAELGNALKLLLDILSIILSVLLGVLGVSLTLALVPVLVATTLELLGQVLREDGGQGTKTTGSLDVSDNTDNDHGRGLQDGNGIDDLTLVHNSSGTVDATDNMGHTGLVGAESGEVGWSGGIIVLGEGADATRVVLGALLGEETQVSAAGSFELTVGHGGGVGGGVW